MASLQKSSQSEKPCVVRARLRVKSARPHLLGDPGQYARLKAVQTHDGHEAMLAQHQATMLKCLDGWLIFQRFFNIT